MKVIFNCDTKGQIARLTPENCTIIHADTGKPIEKVTRFEFACDWMDGGIPKMVIHTIPTRVQITADAEIVEHKT
jgi:hypothetical protein